MVDDTRRFLTAATCGASGLIAAVFLAAPASAEPAAPVPPPVPVIAPAMPAPVPAQPAAAPVLNAAAPVPAVAGDPVPAAPPEGTPHLASPDALPPGSTMDPSAQNAEDPNVSYLKDLWHAVQNQEISGKEALIMGLAQRGMNTPYPTQAAGPNVPLTPANAPLPADVPPPPGAPVSPPPAPAAPLPAPAPAP